jgi:hypothetical protein
MLKFQVKNIEAGTSLQGYITTTRSALVYCFGEPNYTSNEESEKVTCEWEIEFEDGTVATVYDWKRYEEGTPLAEEIYEWHIGGANARACELVSEVLGVPAVVSSLGVK